MRTIRRAFERGHADHGWLESLHTFSFADYWDPAHMGFGNLRVINEDRIAPGTGFGTHGHRDMEIVSYVLAGELAHRDSTGQVTTIRPGEVQRMTAGTGVQHSEFNHARDLETHFLQIWILPAAAGLEPSYEQKQFPESARRGRLLTVAAPDGAEGAITLHADATIRAGLFDGDEQDELDLDPARRAWVQVARGEIDIDGERLAAGDALGLYRESRLTLRNGRDAEVLVFDLAA